MTYITSLDGVPKEQTSKVDLCNMNVAELYKYKESLESKLEYFSGKNQINTIEQIEEKIELIEKIIKNQNKPMLS